MTIGSFGFSAKSHCVSMYFKCKPYSFFCFVSSLCQWMGAGLAGVRGHTVISRVGVVALFALVPAPALHPKMGDKNVLERRTRSNPATPNHVVCLTNVLIKIYSQVDKKKI